MKELWRGGMSYRELWVFLAGLPQDSLTQTRLRDSSLTDLPVAEPNEPQRFGPWSLLNYQLAALTDSVNDLAYVTKVAGGLKDSQGNAPEPPQPTPRPGLTRRSKPQPVRSEAEILYLDRLRAKG